MDAARKIRDDLPAGTAGPIPAMKMNLVVTEVPFKDGGSIDAHIDTSSGELTMEVGHLETPDVTVTIGYDTAKSFFIEQDASAVMQAFMSGKVKVLGDMTKLMAMQAQAPDPSAAVIAQQIKAITA
jgi:putative sterol carrier protein